MYELAFPLLTLALIEWLKTFKLQFLKRQNKHITFSCYNRLTFWGSNLDTALNKAGEVTLLRY